MQARTTTAEDMNATTTTATATTTRDREIIVNGAPLVTAAVTVAALVDEQGFANVKVATAINGEFAISFVDRRRRGGGARRRSARAHRCRQFF